MTYDDIALLTCAIHDGLSLQFDILVWFEFEHNPDLNTAVCTKSYIKIIMALRRGLIIGSLSA